MNAICTEIGCSSFLAVHLETMPVGAYTVELLAPGTGAPTEWTYTCSGTGTATCKQTVQFNGYTATSAQIRITTTNGTVTTQLNNVSYAVLSPNGDECPPVCLQATVILPLPD